MTIIKSKTINAVGYTKGVMYFEHVLRDDGMWYIHYGQSYNLVDENGAPVPELQNNSDVHGAVLDTELQTILPDVWNSLVFLYEWFDGRMREQEETENPSKA